jgi:hypothetical protein
MSTEITGSEILGRSRDRKDESLLFFFLLLVVIFCNCGLFRKDDSELLFFFLLLVILFNGDSCKIGR